MFNILFHYPRVLARHRQGPSAQARERYLTHRADQGAARDTLLRTVRELLVIAQRLDLTTDRMISIRSCRVGYLPPTGFRRPFHGTPELRPTSRGHLRPVGRGSVRAEVRR
jgi:hypothetical protein